MASKQEMRLWFDSRFETSVDAFFHDTQLTDMQRVAGAVDVRKALSEHFPDVAPEEREALAADLDREGAWIDASSEPSRRDPS